MTFMRILLSQAFEITQICILFEIFEYEMFMENLISIFHITHLNQQRICFKNKTDPLLKYLLQIFRRFIKKKHLYSKFQFQFRSQLTRVHITTGQRA